MPSGSNFTLNKVMNFDVKQYLCSFMNEKKVGEDFKYNKIINI